MPHKKIDKIELAQMLHSGRSISQCAEHFKTSISAVSQAKKSLAKRETEILVSQNAERAVENKLDAVRQLLTVNESTLELLEDLKACMLLDPRALEKLNKLAETKRIRLTDPKKLFLSTCGELRKQIELMQQIEKTFFDLSAVQQFQEIVMDTINEVSPDAKDQIIKRLKRHAAFRNAFRPDRKIR
jgi:hypothetical protein